jgi:hypothetical protein
MIYRDLNRLAPHLKEHILKAQSLLNKLVFKFSGEETIITIYFNPENLRVTDQRTGIQTNCHFKLIEVEDGNKKYCFDYLTDDIPEAGKKI